MNVGSVAFKITSNQGAFTKQMQQTANGAQSAFSGATKKIGAALASAFAIKTVVTFGKKCVEVASETQSAWQGLSSIINGQGKSFSAAQGFINDYIKDGLVPLNNAVTAYKNLASRGYDTKQIETTMTALKNSAAYGRQASLSYGDAIQSATEGLKNENSILVDNAGVTKNVSKMWEEYAKSIGTTASALTQQQKIQAEVNGIMKETKWQVNDAARYAKTFAGRIVRLKRGFTRLKTAIGNTIIPIANLFLPYIQKAVDWLIKAANAVKYLMKSMGFAMPTLSDLGGISSTTSSALEAADAISSTGDAAEAAAKKAKKAFASYDEINQLSTSNSASSAVSATNALDTAVSVSGGTEQGESNNFNADKIKDDLKEILWYASAIGTAISGYKIANNIGLPFKGALGVAISLSGVIMLIKGSIDSIINGMSWKSFITMFGGIVGMVSGMALSFGAIPAAISAAIGGITIFAVGVYDAWKNGNSLLNTIAIIVSSIWSFGLGFGAIAVAITLVKNNLDKIKAFLAPLSGWLKESLFSPITEAISTVFTYSYEKISTLVKDIGTAIGSIFSKVKEIFLKIVEIFSALGRAFKQYVLDPIIALFKTYVIEPLSA